ncbi:pimeloyl-ACP methyl ester carboxylesterase [Streptomyces sp. B3I7]|nr:pimeloyl-ACP methyl ester carboxylesterase [Streptomyces sp. B3I7]
MSELFPPVEPHATGMLDVGEGNLVYWEVCGNPEGKPAVVVHGGPGSGCGRGARRYFAPDTYRVVLFDQRGCGRSSPHASDPATDMRAPGRRRANCCARPTGWPESPASWSTAGSTWEVPSTRPGNSPAPGPTRN